MGVAEDLTECEMVFGRVEGDLTTNTCLTTRWPRALPLVLNPAGGGGRSMSWYSVRNACRPEKRDGRGKQYLARGRACRNLLGELWAVLGENPSGRALLLVAGSAFVRAAGPPVQASRRNSSLCHLGGPERVADVVGQWWLLAGLGRGRRATLTLKGRLLGTGGEFREAS